MMHSVALVSTTVLIACLSAIAGCGSSQATVSGNVTFAGQPVASGQIEFAPAAGGGTPMGAPIIAGKYTIKLPPGEKTVHITESPKVAIVTSTEELQRQAAEGRNVPQAPAVSLITPQTAGNSLTVNVKEGVQTLDFPLRTSPEQAIQ